MTTHPAMNGIKTEYSLDNDWILARQRLALLEAHTDVGTIRFLDALDVGDGWRCLEVGGGGVRSRNDYVDASARLGES